MARFMLIRAAGAQGLAQEVARTDPGGASFYGSRPAADGWYPERKGKHPRPALP